MFEVDSPGMHTTPTVDYDIVLDGEVWLELSDGREVKLNTGDVVVQHGARHAWRNKSDRPATIAAILIGANTASQTRRATDMEIGIALAPGMDTPEHIRIAESLGYKSAWCFCSPAIYVDTFTILGLAATKTERIGLGPAVMVPHLRHVADGAIAIATLETLAPGRVTAVVGSGFSATALLNRKSVPWTHVEAYVIAMRELLAGNEIDWDGTRFGLLHTGKMGIQLPISVPIWMAAHGPKGFAAAGRSADGIITNPTHGDEPIPYAGTFAIQFYGTVLDDGEAGRLATCTCRRRTRRRARLAHGPVRARRRHRRRDRLLRRDRQDSGGTTPTRTAPIPPRRDDRTRPTLRHRARRPARDDDRNAVRDARDTQGVRVDRRLAVRVLAIRSRHSTRTRSLRRRRRPLTTTRASCQRPTASRVNESDVR